MAVVFGLGTRLRVRMRTLENGVLRNNNRAELSLVTRPHSRGKRSDSITSRPTVEGGSQHTIVSDHVLTYATHGILSMPRGPHCGAYYSVL